MLFPYIHLERVSMILVVDFMYKGHRYLDKLVEYFQHRNHPFIVAHNASSISDAHRKFHISHIILSGSKAYLQDALHTQHFIDMFNALQRLPKRIPRLGICFGAQLLYHLEGGNLFKMSHPVCAKRIVDSPLLQGKAHFCLHTIFVQPCPSTLQYIGWAQINGQRRPCAIQHRKYPWIGILFHPEEDVATWKVIDHIFTYQQSHKPVHFAESSPMNQ